MSSGIGSSIWLLIVLRNFESQIGRGSHGGRLMNRIRLTKDRGDYTPYPALGGCVISLLALLQLIIFEADAMYLICDLHLLLA